MGSYLLAVEKIQSRYAMSLICSFGLAAPERNSCLSPSPHLIN